MRRILLFFLLVWATPLIAQEPDTSRLPTGVRLGMIYQTLSRPVLAVRPFGASGGLDDVAARATEIVRRDLDYSDRFEMFTVPPQFESGPVDYDAWNGLGVVFLLTGDVEPAAGDSAFLRLVLHDVVYGNVKEVRAFTIPAPTSPDFRMAVHAASDEVVRWATGQPGMAASRIVFVRRVPGGGAELMMVDSDGENVQRIASTETSIYSPTWAPDGRRIVYSIADPDGGWYLEERDLETGRVRTLAGEGMNLTPAYSPDGRRLAFAIWSGQSHDLYDYDIVQGCCRRQLRRGPGEDISPTYSPDGRQIAFMSDRLGQPHIYVMSADGGEATLLSPYTYGEPGYYTSPDWSPTGSLVAFHGRSRGGHPQIMVADASRPGDTVRQLTEEGSSEDPSWAPDGRHLVFVGVRGGRQGLYVMDAVSGRTRPLVLGGRLRLPDWSPTLYSASAHSVRGE